MVDFDAIERSVYDGVRLSQRKRLKRVRDLITPDELAAVLGRDETTVRGWIRDGLPKRTAQNEHRRPWDQDPPVVDLTSGGRRRAVIAGRLTNLSADQQQAITELLATELPGPTPATRQV